MIAITKSKDVDSIPVDELVGSLQSYKSNLPKTNKFKSMASKSVDDIDDGLSSTEVAYLAKNFRNFLRNNNRRARHRNNVNPNNVKKNDTAKNNNAEKSKDKVGQSSNNSLRQQYYGCQGYGHLKSKCPTFLRSKVKLMKFLIMSLKVIKKETSWLSLLLL